MSIKPAIEPLNTKETRENHVALLIQSTPQLKNSKKLSAYSKVSVGESILYSAIKPSAKTRRPAIAISIRRLPMTLPITHLQGGNYDYCSIPPKGVNSGKGFAQFLLPVWYNCGMGWAFRESLKSALFATAVFAMVFGPIGEVYSPYKEVFGVLMIWIPLFIFGSVFVTIAIGLLLQWWLIGKPKIPSKMEDKIRELEREMTQGFNKLEERIGDIEHAETIQTKNTKGRAKKKYSPSKRAKKGGQAEHNQRPVLRGSRKGSTPDQEI